MAGPQFRTAWLGYGVMGFFVILIGGMIGSAIIGLILEAFGVSAENLLDNLFSIVAFIAFGFAIIMGLGLILDLLDQSRLREPIWIEKYRHQRKVSNRLKKFEKLIDGARDFTSQLERMEPTRHVDKLYLMRKKTMKESLVTYILIPIAVTFAISLVIGILNINPKDYTYDLSSILRLLRTLILFAIATSFLVGFISIPVYVLILNFLNRLSTVKYQFISYNGELKIRTPKYRNTLNYANTETTPDNRILTVLDGNKLLFFKIDGTVQGTVDFERLEMSKQEIDLLTNYIAQYEELFQFRQELLDQQRLE